MNIEPNDSNESSSIYQDQNNDSNKKFKNIGIFIITIGVFLLLKRTPLIHDNIHPIFYSSQMLMIILFLIDYLFGSRHKVFLIILGFAIVSLINEYGGISIDLGHYLFPLLFVALGIYFVKYKGRQKPNLNVENHSEIEQSIKIDCFFSGAKKVVNSAHFQGGKVSVMFGGVEIDFKEAAIGKEAILDINLLFGSVELIVPSNWVIVNQMTVAMGSVEDKRRGINTADDKVNYLILKGIVFCGGVELKSY